MSKSSAPALSATLALSASLEKVSEASVAHHIKGIRPALSVMLSLGFSATDCLAGTCITLAQLEERDQGISLEQEYAFYRRLLALSKMPLLGLQLGRAYRVENYGMLGYAILSAATLGEALAIARDFGPLSFSHFEIDFRLDKRDACIIMRQNKALDATLLSLYEDRDCSAIVHGTHHALNAPLPIKRIELMHGSDERQAYEAFFGCPVRFEQPHMAIYFPVEILARPMPLRDPETSAYCRQQCQQLLNKIKPGENLSSRVRQFLQRQVLQKESAGMPGIKTLCQEFGMSERSLRRKLAEEGCSFQALIKQARFDQAKALLADGLKLEEIAARLGYSEAGNFSHAFKRWSGMSPREFRDQKLP